VKDKVQMPEQDRLLTLTQVSKNFGGVQAVKNLSFHVNSNEIVGLIGPNGSGKSTSVNLISGAVPPSSETLFGETKMSTNFPSVSVYHWA
jgi:branched-chain amino acid transport system ATP-binding protein